MSARLLIDGYNLLFASDVFASPSGPPTLERTRAALLQFLAEVIEEKVRRRSTIVFDATHAPPSLPHEMEFAGLRILFSRNPNDADALLEELLLAERSPRELLVISSDHRVQRAARQRGAKYIDSEVWIREVRVALQKRASDAQTKPAESSWENSPELAQWLSEFNDVKPQQLTPNDADLPPLKQPSKPAASKPAQPAKKSKQAKPPKSRRPISDDKPVSNYNPFPPGYAEDVEE